MVSVTRLVCTHLNEIVMLNLNFFKIRLKKIDLTGLRYLDLDAYYLMHALERTHS